MKAFFLFFLLFGTFCGVSFADDTIQFEVSTQELELGDRYQNEYPIGKSGKYARKLQIDIPGLENFEVFSQGQSFSFHNINGEAQSMLQYTIVASAKTPGTFSGPVVLGNGSELSQTIQCLIYLSWKKAKKCKHRDAILQILFLKNKNLKHEKYFDLKKTGHYFFDFSFLRFLLSLSQCFFSLKKYFAEQSIREKPPSEKLPQDEVAEISHRDFFQKLLIKSDALSHEVFFESFNGKLRDIFGSILGTEVQFKTLGELETEKQLISHPLFGIFQKSYMLQYHPQGADISQRRKLCESILSLL